MYVAISIVDFSEEVSLDSDNVDVIDWIFVWYNWINWSKRWFSIFIDGRSLLSNRTS